MSLQIIERRMRELIEQAETDPKRDVGPELARLLATAWDIRRPAASMAG